MPSLTRGQRHMLEYATHSGTDKSRLKRKRPEDIAPALHRRHKLRIEEKALNESATKAEGHGPRAPVPVPLCADVLDYLRANCPATPAKLSRGELRVVDFLSAEEQGAMDFAVKRIEVTSQPHAYAIAALVALQRCALSKNGRSGALGSSLLLLVGTDAEALALAAHMRRTYGLTHVLVLDTEAARFPTFPTLSEESDATLSDRTALVIASVPSLLLVDARSAIWKFIGAYILLRGSTSFVAAMEEKEQTEFLTKVCRQRWRCLGHARVAAVIASSRKALVDPLSNALTTQRVPLDGEPCSQQKQEKIQKKQQEEKEQQQEEEVGGQNGEAHVLRQPITVHYTVVEGMHRLHTLYALVMGLRAGQGLVVHFATREACQFVNDVLYALGDLPASLLLLSDYEGESSYMTQHANEEDRRRICAQFDQTVASGGATQKDRAVLLSVYGIVPKRGSVFLQYDLMVDVLNYAQFVSDLLTPAAYNEVAVSSVFRGHSRTPSPAPRTDSRGKSKVSSTCVGAHPEKAMYRHIIVLLRKNETQAALPLLKAGGKRLQIAFEPMPHVPSATRYLIAMQKVKALHKKQFAIQNAAYAAYRATMLLYAVIGPAAVYDERRVDIAKVAEEFGYAQAPILDLRTRDTEFRPREDIYRVARERALLERRKLKAFVAENIVGEGPEDHVVDEEVERS